MRFDGAFECSRCGELFAIGLGPQWMAEQKTTKKIGEGLGQLAVMFARSCKEHETDCPASGSKGGG